MGLAIISILIVIAVLSPSTNSLKLCIYFSTSGTWSSPHVTGDVPPPDWSFTFTKVSNHQVVLRGGWENMDTYVLDLSRMVSLRTDKIRKIIVIVCFI